MSHPGIPHMDITEFRVGGFLQEANRQFFHPLGLALVVKPGFENREEVQAWLKERGVLFGDDAVDSIWTFIKEMGLDREHLSGVWDFRHDDEGVTFGPGVLNPDRASQVADERERHRHARQDLMGDVVQPLVWEPPSSDASTTDLEII